MRQIFTILIAFAISVSFVSCSKASLEPDTAEEVAVSAFAVDRNVVVIPADGTEQFLSVVGAVGNRGCFVSGALSNFYSVEVTKLSGKGDYRLGIVASENKTGTVRTGRIGITDGLSLVWVEIRQEPQQ